MIVLEYVLYTYIIAVNIYGFFLMCDDKNRAIKNKRRTPERKLLTVAIIGGAAGTLLGMKLARHKTLHKKFSVGVPLLLLVQYVVFWLINRYLLLILI